MHLLVNSKTMFLAKTNIRVRYAETDQMNVVYHGNYAQYFEVARAEAIRGLGFTYKEMEALGVIMRIVELHVKYLRPAHYDDLLTIHTILKEMPDRHRIEFFQDVYNEAGKLLANGRVVIFFMNSEKMTRTNIPNPLKEKLLHFFVPTA
jgi:acyl-CoA thioester hydrolase